MAVNTVRSAQKCLFLPRRTIAQIVHLRNHVTPNDARVVALCVEREYQRALAAGEVSPLPDDERSV